MSIALSLTRRRTLLAAAAAILLPLGPVFAQQAVPEITPAEAQAQAKAGKITLIDVRTPDEWRETGVAAGATPINLYHPGGAEGFVKEVVAKVGGKRDTPIAFICRSGNRSGQAQRLLAAQGFTNVFSVREGMSGSAAGPGWIRSGLPVETCKTC
ncbi:rhodanese-like domain-containing protein [Aromatoleum toluclasticum]|uniref:rhodanese-like domain-containing protein n=1 Tax=Aromatoleum toluclasticum TaxID=92003 RepID=UPI00037EDEDF|nr:rhodanese-like domain-containing protein [Aromatoleum toluclasticum]MCC4115480.1 rhodanese-like domain-containing protein [Aromatoleum toluclasticum]